jgi:hypothetical protein
MEETTLVGVLERKMTTHWHEKRDTPEASFSEALPPCKLCRHECIAVGNGLCDRCMKETIHNAIFNR